MLFEKHEILAVQDGCVATHSCVLCAPKQIHFYIGSVAFFSFFKVIVVPENSNFFLEHSKKLWPAYFPFVN